MVSLVRKVDTRVAAASLNLSLVLKMTQYLRTREHLKSIIQNYDTGQSQINYNKIFTARQ